MSRRRTDMHRLQELVRLHRMGRGVRDVARLLRMSPNTERKYREALAAEGLLEGAATALPSSEVLKAAVLKHHPPRTPEHERSSLAAWEPRVQALMAAGLKARAIYDRLTLEGTDFDGSYWAVKRLVRRLAKDRGPRPEDVAIPVDTPPGEAAQVDFGYVGRLFDPATQTLRRAWVFVMVLGYSRHMFARVVFDQKAATWLQLHVEAFRHFDGTPRVLVPDNLKAAVVRASFGIDGPTGLHRSYRELARHYGFLIDPTPPYAPNKKGKVEASVKYVKRNFFLGREGEDVATVNGLLDRWVLEVAGCRVHGTTRQQPLACFEAEEQVALRPRPSVAFEPIEWKQAVVHPDCCITFDRRLYSAPWKLVGQ